MTVEEFRAMFVAKGARRKPRHIESAIQKACVDWFRFAYPEYLIFSVPNGGSRNAIEAAHLKKEGALAGVSDLIVVAWHTVIFVEMKTPKGRQSDHQRKFEQKVAALGHTYIVCHSLDEFKARITMLINKP